MAKLISLGSAKPDSPIYSGGSEIFSHPASIGPPSDSREPAGEAPPKPPPIPSDTQPPPAESPQVDSREA